jgi:uncharacterized membrane protein (UPF0127 family)
MKIIEKKRLLFFILILIASYGWTERQYKKFAHGRVVFSKQQLAINVEVATTKVQRTIGLMFREYLPPNKGMLFVFEQETIQKIWMKDTLIPLDVIFISEEGKIVSMIRELQPCVKKTCDIYYSDENAKYMLEINKGMIEKNKIETGQFLLLFL